MSMTKPGGPFMPPPKGIIPNSRSHVFMTNWLNPNAPIRQVSVFTPPQILGNLLWLDASDPTSISQTGGLVDQWRDKSGNVNHASGLASTRFTTGAATQNALNVLSVSNGNLMTLAAAIVPNDITIITAAKVNAGGGANGQIIIANSGSTVLPLFGFVTGQVSWDGFVGGANNGAVYDIYSATKVVGGGAVNVYAGSTIVALATGTSALSGANTFNALCNYAGLAAYNFAGLLGEIIVYNRVINNTELGQVFAYLKGKWGTP